MFKIDNIFERSTDHQSNVNYTIPHFGSFLNSDTFKNINKPVNLLGNIPVLAGTTKSESSSEGLLNDLKSLETLITPPNETYSDILPPEAGDIASKIDGLATQQFIKQFYEVYMSPLGLKEVYNRLGTIAGNIDDVHLLYPNGVDNLIASDVNASWKTSVNFEVEIDEGLYNTKTGKKIKPTRYASLGFPPFVKHETANLNDLLSNSKETDTPTEAIRDTSFDMNNILYKRGKATTRFPAFKQINDNIHTLQVLLNRCFGIESTYMNEWDLSLYMQEGLCSYIEKVDSDGSKLRLPQFVTTLSYGLLDDVPVSQKGSSVDLNTAATFASINLAVSTRYAIDNQPLGQKANDTNYIISSYPYSAYWYPSDVGVTNKTLNVSEYIDEVFSFNDNGLAFDEDRPTSHNFTPAIFHGKDLSKSTRDFLDILNYNDIRYAVLSGWNSTDVNGRKYLSDSDTSNESVYSNAFSYLPFWKQFYTTDEDGMSEVDLYLQEILAADREASFLNVGFQIINLTTAGNDPFQYICEVRAKKRFEEKRGYPLGSDEDFKKVIPSKYGAAADEPGDIYIKVGKIKIRIPKTKLLNMFFNRKTVTSKAKAAADNGSSSTGFGGMSGSGKNKKNSGLAGTALSESKPSKALGKPQVELDENGQEVEVTRYQPEDSDELCSKKTVGDGVAEFSPFIYGGPHGKYYSPLTLEGYTQLGNQNLANVPTVDSYATFSGIRSEKGTRGFEFSKNWKNAGSYADTVTCLTPNEREALTRGSAPFGVFGMKPDTRYWLTYTSNTYGREYFTDWGKYITIRFWRWTWRIPNFWYFKWFRTLNGHYRNWVGATRDYGTGYYTTRSHTGRWENDEAQAEDWLSQDFRLLPTPAWSDQWTTDVALDRNQVLRYLSRDESNFTKPAKYTVDEDDNIVWIWRPNKQHIQQNYLKWLIVPSDVGTTTACGVLDETESSDRRYLHWSTYSAPGSKWYNQLKRLWTSGTRELSVTLPITDESGQIINLVCGVANICKSRSLSWGWRLKQQWYLTWTYGWDCWHSWWRWWFWRWHEPRPRWVYYWKWCYVRVFQDTYEMYFKPHKIQWTIPTDKLLDREAQYSFDKRNPDSTNIIERYAVGGKTNEKAFTGLNINQVSSPKIFPFSLGFIQKYGRYEPNTPIPGVSATQHERPFQDLKVLHTKGVYFRDVMTSFKQKGYVETVVSVIPYTKTFPQTVYYADEAAGTRYSQNGVQSWFQSWFGRWYEISSRFGVAQNVTFYADQSSYMPDRKGIAPEITKIIRECQGYPAIQTYQIGKTPYMAWYHPTETIQVFIDTATQQIAWLKQLKNYIDTFLTDNLIFDLYRKSVDNIIQGIVEANYKGDVKGGEDYIAKGGWTDSFTEDINYHDALAIVRNVFDTTNTSRNTLSVLVAERIDRLTSIKNTANVYKKHFRSNPEYYMHCFMRLVTNTRSYLLSAVTDGQAVQDVIFNPDGSYVDSSLFEVNSRTVYNMYKNPAAVLWAYINVLYHVRKYWINLRMNKRAGSYWQLRGLERVLTFMLANSTAEDSPLTPQKSIPQGTPETLKTKLINYVQPRTTFNDRLSESEIKTTYTKAVYIKVDYTKLPNPELSPKWNNTTKRLNDQEIVWVPDSWKWAYKPQDGLYYIMSTTITNNISQYIKSLKTIVSTIHSKDYITTDNDFVEVLRNCSDNNVSQTHIEKIKDLKPNQQLSTYVGRTTVENEAITIFINQLLQIKHNLFMDLIKKQLYAVYIRWSPEHVWTGQYENDVTGGWHIDDWQYKETFGKERTVTDMYGIEHNSSEGISAGITFDIVAGLNPENLLESPDGLKKSSALEILCGSVERMDLWRVEVPSGLDIPITALKDKPRLVPAYQIDMSVSGLIAKKIEPSQKSLLMGALTNSISPVLETTEDLLTINSLAAIGQFDQISTPF